MHNEQLVCNFFSWLDCFSEQNRFVPTFPTGKGGSGQGTCTDSIVMPNNHVRHGTGWVEVASPPEGNSATLAILVWPQTLGAFLNFVLSPQFFLTADRYLGVKNAHFTPYP
jgi:hypothetical protein